jgi:hypothetical protein
MLIVIIIVVYYTGTCTTILLVVVMMCRWFEWQDGSSTCRYIQINKRQKTFDSFNAKKKDWESRDGMYILWEFPQQATAKTTTWGGGANDGDDDDNVSYPIGMTLCLYIPARVIYLPVIYACHSICLPFDMPAVRFACRSGTAAMV